MKKLVCLIAALLWPLSSFAQIVLPGGGGSGGGGGGGVTSFATTCPATGPSTGAISLNNLQNVISETTSYNSTSADCGSVVKFTLSASATYGLPAPSSGFYVAGVTNVPTSTNTLTISPSSGNICSASCAGTYSLAIGKTISIYTDGTNYYVSDSSNVSLPQTTVGYVSNRWYPTNFGAQSSTGANLGAGNVTCAAYVVSSPGLTFKSFGVDITTADAANFISMAIYTSNSSGVPATLIDGLSAGITATPTGFTSAAPANGTDFLAAGTYWVCYTTNSTTAVIEGQTATQASTGIMGGGTGLTAITGGTSGIGCTAGVSGCGPAWTTGGGSAYTWASSMATATWSFNATSGRGPYIVLESN